MGVHQKIDRVARRHIEHYLPDGQTFPSTKEILHFEGKHGPDGLKRKSPGRDEPWHFIDPRDTAQSALLEDIRGHMNNLIKALKSDDTTRSAFEAAWLAHAVTDGLTPAHHIPYEDALAELRGGKHHSTRTSKHQKVVMPGDTLRQTVRNNWSYWGARGMMTAHIQFELGVASSVATMKFDRLSFDADWLDIVTPEQFHDEFLRCLARIDAMQMYKGFEKSGWTTTLARQTKNTLVPEIIRMVMCAWRVAAREASI